MPRRRADITITVNIRGESNRIAITRMPMGVRYWVKINGRNSARLPDSTVSEVMRRVLHMIVRMA